MGGHTESSLGTYNEWKVEVARTFDEVVKMRQIWQEMQSCQSEPAPNADIDRYLSVLKAEQKKVQPYVIRLYANGNPVAMVIGKIEEGQLSCRLGYKVLYKPSVRCLTVVYRGIIGHITDNTSALIVLELLSALHKGEADVAYLSHIKTDSPVYKAARKIPSFLRRGHFPIIQKHWVMSVPQNIEDFYKNRSKRHRANMKRYIRRLEKEYPRQVQIITYCQEDEIQKAINDASKISSKTYQYALGKGLTNNNQTLILMKSAAKHKWLQIHILYINNQPCAFQIGLRYGRTYFLDQIAYDPDWKQYNVGTVLFLKVLESLCEDCEIDFLDFGFGDADYKQSYGDKKWSEALVYIFAPRFYPLFVNMLSSSLTGLSLGLNYLARKTHFIGWIKRHWRDKLQPKK